MSKVISKSAFLNKVLSQPDALKAEKCRRSFFYFVQEFWEVVIHEEPVYNWHIPFLCAELETVFRQVVNRRPKLYDLVINIPPGTTKSTICTIMFPVWTWIAINPEQRKKKTRDGDIIDFTGGDLRFITGSYAAPLSLEHAEYSRDIVKSDKYQRYFPEVEIRRDKDSKSNFKTNLGGTRFSTSVLSTVTGVHGHFLIIDDPLNPLQAISDVEREKANHWLDHTLSTRKVDKAITVTILIMQRLHKLDPTGMLISKKGKKVRHIVLPGNLEYDNNGRAMYGAKPASLEKHYIDGLLDPVRLSQDVCADMKIDLGPYGYAGQVGQDPKAREGAMFQEDWFEVVDAAPAGGTEWVRGWDLAATTVKESKSGRPAYTAGVKMKAVNGIFYIGHSIRFRKSPNNVRLAVKNIASQDEDGVIVDLPQDPGQAGKAQVKDFVSLLAGYNVRYSTESGDKVLRAEPFSAQCEAGNVKLVRGDWNAEYIEDITFFPNGFKDLADASCRAFTRVVKMKDNRGGVVGGPGGFKTPKKEE